jgi:hypothetical protein
LYAARGRLIPFNSNSLTGSTFTAFSTLRTDEDLTRLGFVAKTRANVGYRPDGGVVEAALEADGPERGKADTETDVVPQPNASSQ